MYRGYYSVLSQSNGDVDSQDDGMLTDNPGKKRNEDHQEEHSSAKKKARKWRSVSLYCT
jgi:hypothetical protein